MALHDELLALAKELVDRNLGAAVEGDLRRGVSTAYYALFHLLVHETTNRLVAVAPLRPRVARALDHRIMRQVCQDYARLTPNNAGQLVLGGQIVPQDLQDIAIQFVALQEARHQADYDTAASIIQGQAQTNVMRAELAFLSWAAVAADPATDTFLTELLCRGMPRR
jgi:hypothetical protein